MRGFRYLDEQLTLSFEPAACTGCGTCAEVCPHGVFAIVDGRAQLVEPKACMECGACARNCSFGAIEVRSGVGCASAIISSWFARVLPDRGDSGDAGCC